MKTLFVSLFLLFSPSVYSQVVDNNCTYKGVKLYGEVEVVTSFADFRVYISSSRWSNCYPVELVSSLATECHEWEIVNSFPDFTIEIVSSEIFADFSIYLESSLYKKDFLNEYVGKQ